MERLSILCFAGTYGLALASDLARVLMRGTARRWSLTVGLTGLGWAVHTVYLANALMQYGAQPVANVRGSLLVLAWVLAAIDLYLVLRSPRPLAVGLFVLPVVIGLSAFAAFAKRGIGWVSWTGPIGFWVAVHVTFQLLGAVATCVAFVAGLMYLAQVRRLKRKQPAGRGLPLPSLEQSERLNRGAITLAFPLLSFGLGIGAALIVATNRSGAAALSWTDPKVLSGGALWLIFAVLLHARFRPAMRGRGVIALTVIAFGFLLFTWVGVGFLVPTAHGVPSSSSVSRGAP